ncbi:MAG: hypothetical protein KAJ51_11610 [Thermoplasmata archaeon]|nr:hypothetical protein [Thermoplasmata archaeon]
MATIPEHQILYQKVCYYSSPEYQKTFKGKYLYIYESKGYAIITNKTIIYRSNKFNFDIPISSIVDIKINRFRKFQKPIELQYVEITYQAPHNVTVLLVPTESSVSTVWNTNKIVQYWYNLIQHLRYQNSTQGVNGQKIPH